MDAASRDLFRWKFYHLVIVLNLVILAVAIAVITLFLTPYPYRVIIPVISIVVAILSGIYFYRKYHEVKKWLNEHA